MANFNVKIWQKVGKAPMEFSIDAADIHEASRKVHSLKKYGADKACEIQIKGGEKKKPAVEPPAEEINLDFGDISEDQTPDEIAAQVDEAADERATLIEDELPDPMAGRDGAFYHDGARIQ